MHLPTGAKWRARLPIGRPHSSPGVQPRRVVLSCSCKDAKEDCGLLFEKRKPEKRTCQNTLAHRNTPNKRYKGRKNPSTPVELSRHRVLRLRWILMVLQGAVATTTHQGPAAGSSKVAGICVASIVFHYAYVLLLSPFQAPTDHVLAR